MIAENHKPEDIHKLYTVGFSMNYFIATMKPIQISIWNGIVMGGGVGCSQYAPIRIATEKTLYAMPETNIGFFCDSGSSYFLPKIKGNASLGIYMGLLGHRLKGDEVLQWGLATHYVELDKIVSLR